MLQKWHHSMKSPRKPWGRHRKEQLGAALSRWPQPWAQGTPKPSWAVPGHRRLFQLQSCSHPAEPGAVQQTESEFSTGWRVFSVHYTISDRVLPCSGCTAAERTLLCSGNVNSCVWVPCKGALTAAAEILARWTEPLWAHIHDPFPASKFTVSAVHPLQCSLITLGIAAVPYPANIWQQMSRGFDATRNQRAPKHTWAVWQPQPGRQELRHPSAASTRLGWEGWTPPSLSVAFWEDWHYTDRMWSVPEGEGSWLKAERMENVRCCFCLALGTDPAEIITEEFTLPCQICRYFAVLRFDVLFL